MNNKLKVKDKQGNEVEVQVFFEHYRPYTGVFQYDPAPKKGRPDNDDLYRYSRGKHEDGRAIGFRVMDVDRDKEAGYWGRPHPTGGKTICSIRLNNSEHVTGVSWCSYSDPFNYRLGRQIALGRALHNANLTLI